MNETRSRSVPADVRSVFLAALADVSVHGSALADPLLTGRVHHPRTPDAPSRELFSVRADHDENGWLLDFYRDGNDDHDFTRWHGRIRADGTRTALENFEGDFGRRVFDDPLATARERHRVRVHNARVAETLRTKGLQPPLRDEHGLRHAILDDPDAEGPRRDLAGYLRRRAHPQGEFIDLQLDLAATAASGHHDGPLIRRERELLRAHGAEWAAPIADLVDDYRFHRGAVGEITLPLDRFLAEGAHLRRLAPIQHVNLTGTADRLAELLVSPHLAGLVSLELVGLGLTDDHATQLATAPGLDHLHWLGLSHNRIGEPGVRALAASPHLHALPVLDLTRNPCDPVPRPGGNDLDGRVTAIDRTPLTDELFHHHGPHWLANPENPDTWPLPRDSYR
ncbi:hypothetical protein [Nocardia lasii]|uniref:Uncharacterized protein n=1 Tax=Nocardia lasii TaxID=1616107 RepID=A0ABW1JNA6_9NOCA